MVMVIAADTPRRLFLVDSSRTLGFLRRMWWDTAETTKPCQMIRTQAMGSIAKIWHCIDSERALDPRWRIHPSTPTTKGLTHDPLLHHPTHRV